MSVAIKIDAVVKKHGESTTIPGLSLHIQEGEFFTLLGPSGCGKTTLLRMIAGFNTIEAGTISFNDDVINNRPPKDRNIGMVFQNYAVFPQMTVAKNVGFGLANGKVPKADAARRVDKVLDSVHITQLKDRLPANMSGGQQQRIALARAIVIEPAVLLMDEPLSNLDAKLRVEMRDVIKDIQHSVGITTVYVTHDQEEAMAVSDRIAVMNNGRVQHAGTPVNIYHRPANVFVADFIGKANFLERTLESVGDRVLLALAPDYRLDVTDLVHTVPPTGKVIVSLRPECLSVSSDGVGMSSAGDGMEAKIVDSAFLGSTTHYRGELATGEHIEFVDASDIETVMRRETKARLSVAVAKLNIFDAATEQSITVGVMNDAELD
ncbi:MAG TPA: ABC transporter ATP-binding protein [Humibacter sp.]|nr:ABC transporter ATP-binding protein [Humibacter sp.]